MQESQVHIDRAGLLPGSLFSVTEISPGWWRASFVPRRNSQRSHRAVADTGDRPLINRDRPAEQERLYLSKFWMMNDQISKVVCFGEILWDILPGGTVPGGAPMNVAYHLHQLNESPALVTRVGNDQRGEEIRAILKEKDVDIRLLQTDDQYPTGIVYGTADENGDMRYEIVAPSAWDFIEASADAVDRVETAGYFVCGSLSARHDVSRSSLFTLLDKAKTAVVDINLRPPFYTPELIERLMAKADILKLNNDELELVSSWWGFGGDLHDQVAALQQQFHTKTIIITCGANGAAVWHERQLYEHPGFRVKVADTVGSGDAFLAGFLHQRLQERAVDEALEFACALGAFVASKKGASP